MRATTHGVKFDKLNAAETLAATSMAAEGFDTIEIRDQLRATRIAGGGRLKAQIYEWQIYNAIAERTHPASQAA